MEVSHQTSETIQIKTGVAKAEFSLERDSCWLMLILQL